MTPSELSAKEARLRAAHDGSWHGGPHQGDCEKCAFIANAPSDIAALLAEVKRLREALRQACTCVTCNGAGEIDVVTGYKDNGPNDPIEVYELDECPECDGSKIGSHVEEATARVLEDCQ